METAQEIRFQNLIIRNIELSNDDFEDRFLFLKEFNENKHQRYDQLCDIVYELLKENKQEKLFITYNGIVKLEKPKNSQYFTILDKEDYIFDYLDIIEYVNVALDNLNSEILDIHFHRKNGQNR